jgi:hypothetical protein
MLATPAELLVVAGNGRVRRQGPLHHGLMGRIISRMWVSALDRYGASDQS